MFAAAWWGIFYPELCFTEETCEAVQAEAATAGQIGAGEAVSGGQIDAGEIWRADSDRLVISSRFLEWCEERLTAGKE